MRRHIVYSAYSALLFPLKHKLCRTFENFIWWKYPTKMPGMLLQSAAPMTNADYVLDQFYCVGVFVRARRIDTAGVTSGEALYYYIERDRKRCGRRRKQFRWRWRVKGILCTASLNGSNECDLVSLVLYLILVAIVKTQCAPSPI
jgi:hypothetical protein